ncbi:hypothetical protein [Salinigranum sp. GCM10025319]|uniref:hypothetical protein n=1 Tax=Salinigranum sp. GCM10025319 TaxID=3252687 RepID=UPI0036167FFD
MDTPLVELLPELVELLLFSLGSLVLSAVGAYLEHFAFTTVESGQVALGGWEALMGLLAIYFSYLLLTDKCWPRFSELRRRLVEA